MDQAPDRSAMIVVLGPYRSGTSCVAGILQRLGVDMGRDWHQVPGEQPETYEDKELWHICRAAFREPEFDKREAPERVRRRLAAWAGRQRSRAAAEGRRPGAKHPLLCALIPEMRRAFGPLVAVSVTRPLEASIASLQRQDWWRVPQGRYAAVQRFLWRERERHLPEIPHVGVAFDDVLADPVGEVERLADALDLPVGPEARREAAASVGETGTAAIGRSQGRAI